MKTAIYARVSTETQEKQETIGSQLEALREYASKNNYSIYEEYIDDGYSGDLLDRPSLDRLRDDAKNKIFSAVLVHSPDRLSRKFLYLALLQEEFKRFSIKVIFLNRPESKDTPEDNLLEGIQGLIAEYEKSKIMERTRRGKLHKVKNNLLIGSIPPYGYKYIVKDKTAPGRYEMLEEEAGVVRLIFDLLVNKRLSVRGIARELTRRNIPPRIGRHWRTSTIHRILRNETYAGVTYYNKHISVEPETHNKGSRYRRAKNTCRRLRPKEQWIAISLGDELHIISREMFEAAQRQLIRNSELSPRNVKYKYLLRGLLYCGVCNSPFCGAPMHGKLFYRCGNRYRTFPLPAECRVPIIRSEAIESRVWEKFCEAVRNPAIISEQIAKLKKSETVSEESIELRLKSIDKELSRISISEDRLLDAYRANVITMEQLKSQMARAQGEKTQLEEEMQNLLSRRSYSLPPNERAIEEYCQMIEERLLNLSDDFEGRRYLLLLAINKIIVTGKTILIKGIIPVEEGRSGRIASIMC